ncbi:MAG TPA: enolase C-terminal domain-like protein, partial [Acidimicrobiales bacterium]|nr:enolase C-terminal domain-like protein [Acidimicrobiales bacterium]
MLEITDIRAILTAPAGTDLVVVKVETSEPELYGLGCATYTQRAVAVGHVVDHYLKPLLVGRDALRIEDIWQSVAGSAYWRNGPVLNNALSGVDEALWDITGKLAGLPVYQLLGGKCRDAATVYRHADGRTLQEVEEKARSLMAEGITHVRCQFGGYGGSGVRGEAAPDWAASGAVGSVAVFDPAVYARNTRRLFEHVRSALGEEVELLHDVHERLAPPDAVRLASDLDQYRLFFLEDALSPEHPEWWPRLRQHSVTPIAMGELFNHPLEWQPLVQDQLIDYIR